MKWLSLLAMAWFGESAARAQPNASEKIALALLEQQLVAIQGPNGLSAALPPDAVVLGNGRFALAGDANGAAVARTIAHAPVLQTAISRFSVGARDDVMWIDADVTFFDGSGCGATDTRMFELAVSERGQWRPVAVAFASTSELATAGDELAAPARGPLTTDLGSVRTLEDALRDDPTVAVAVSSSRGTGELAHGPDASRRLLASLQDRTIAIRSAIEVHGGRWGFASGELAVGADPHGNGAALAARAIVFAVLDHQRWSVVAADIQTDAPGPAPPCRITDITGVVPLADQLRTIEP